MKALSYITRNWTGFEWKMFLLGPLTIFAASILIFSFFEAQKPKDFASWKMTKGRVYEVNLQKFRGSGLELIGRHRGSDREKFQLAIRYGYSVSGLTYTSTKVGFGPVPRGGGVEMRTRFEPFFSTSEIDVYYDPEDPSHAVLVSPADTPVGILLLAATGFSLVFALAAAVINTHTRRPNRSYGPS